MPRRDHAGLVILGVLVAAEIAILYVVIATETPLTPFVHRLLRNPAGIIVLVGGVVFILILGMIAFTSWAEWYHKRRADEECAAKPGT